MEVNMGARRGARGHRGMELVKMIELVKKDKLIMEG
jgi:hypothetical protein